MILTFGLSIPTGSINRKDDLRKTRWGSPNRDAVGQSSHDVIRTGNRIRSCPSIPGKGVLSERMNRQLHWDLYCAQQEKDNIFETILPFADAVK
jgi:hypothetical protein